MATGREKFKFDGSDAVFYIKTFPARPAARKLAELQRYIAAPLAAMDIAGAFDGDDDKIMEAVVKAIGSISATLDEKTLDKLMAMLLDADFIAVEIDGEPAQRLDDTVFDLAVPDVAVLFELMMAVVKVNFASAFTRGLARIGSALKSKGMNLSARFRPKSSLN